MFEQTLEEVTSARGRASIALSRPTPAEVFEEVAQIRLPRRPLQVFQVDERQAKEETDDRNSLLIRKKTLGPWMDEVTFHPMGVDSLSFSRAARRYADLLEDRCGRPPVLDLVHLGLGEDGHTASLTPGDPALEVKDAWVATTKRVKGHRRMTMTFPTLDAARLVVFTVSGAAKAEALSGVVRGDRRFPAARLEAPNVLILADAEAAARL